MSKAELSYRQPPPPTILSFLYDAPNLCSLAGLACTASAIYFSLLGIYPAAMIGMAWAVAFDWADGLIARRSPNRSKDKRHFGGQLDLLIDIVSYGVTPAVLLLCYGQFQAIYLACAFVILATSALRLSYYATFGLSDETKYTGLALDNNSLAIVFLFLFEGIVSTEAFTSVLCITCLSLSALNVSQLQTNKLSGKARNVLGLLAYCIIATFIFSWKLV